MDSISNSKLDEMKNVDIRTVDPNTLVDMKEVTINTELPKRERILDFINQIKNPYCYKCGNTIIKITFADTDVTLDDKIENYLKSL